MFGYARVSTKGQNVDRQTEELRKYVSKAENLYIDKQSGKDFDRVAYQQVKAALRDGDDLYVKSLDRLGRNKQQIKDELQQLRGKGVFVHILDFPQTMIQTKDEQQREILELATNIIIEIIGYMAEQERENIKKRQAEGIAVWRRTGRTKTGRPYGRPKKEAPKNWIKVYDLWKRKEIKTKEAISLLGVGKNTFYRFVHESK
ncbi:MAG TPA: resolvase [Selenomonas sp.]|nr:resolvase [Selenomonas sp.]